MTSFFGRWMPELAFFELKFGGTSSRAVHEGLWQYVRECAHSEGIHAQRQSRRTEMLTQLIATFGMSASRKIFSETIAQNTYLDLEKLSQEANPSQEESNTVLKDVQKFLLTKQLTDPEQSASNPFGFMDDLTTSQIGFLIKDEPAKIKAFVIVRMESEEAAELFRDIPKDERTNVALEMGKLHELPLELVEKIGYNLAEKARKVPDEGTVGVDGIKFIADVLSDLDNSTRDELINGMRTTDVKMSENIARVN